MRNTVEIFRTLSERKLTTCWREKEYIDYIGCAEYYEIENPLHEDYNQHYPRRLKYFDEESKSSISILSDPYESTETYDFNVKGPNIGDYVNISFHNFEEALSYFKEKTGIMNPYVYTNRKSKGGLTKAVLVKKSRPVAILKKRK